MLGNKLREMMRKARVSDIMVSKAISPPMCSMTINRWVRKLNAGKLDDDKWYKLGRALTRLGVDAERIRPVKAPLPSHHPTELVPLLKLFSAEQKEALCRILTADESSIEVLRLFLEHSLGK